MANITIDQAMRVAIQHQLAGRLSAAEEIYRQVLAQHPDHPQALHLLGVICHETGHNDVAADLIRRAIRIKPVDAEAHYNLGNALRCQGKREEAIAAYRQAIGLKPEFAEAWSNLGNELRLAEQLDEAVAACSRAIALRPGYAQACNNLGIALNRQGKLEGAIAAGRRAVALKPDYAEGHSNLGAALSDAGELDAAICACRLAIQIHPRNFNFYNNLGVTLRRAGQLDEAVSAFRCAIDIRPDDAASYSNLGNALKDTGQIGEAIAAYRHAIALQPGYSDAHSNLIFAMHFDPDQEPCVIAEAHRQWGRMHAEPLRRFIHPHPNERCPERRLRIGYVSPDFRQHAVASMVLPLLASHDREKFQVLCYAQVQMPDAVTDRFRAHADRWRSTVGLSDEQMAHLVRQDQIDILVDLAGHTAGGRLLVFARKPAPVQIARLGYPNTTGLSTMDYRMTDGLADPPGVSDTMHLEQLVRLPRTNWIYQAPENSPAPHHRPPDGSVTFGCFNNFAKVTEPMLQLWGRILQAVPESRLLLKAQGLGSPSTRQRLGELFTKAGLDPARLELRGLEPGHGGHLALYNRVDIALDPFPYHGTTTTCEALWMGVPVISLAGHARVSRVGVSLLTTMGLAGLIADTPEDYARIAVELAHDLPRLSRLHSTLRRRMEQSPLMDAPNFAREVEAVYRRVWRKWCADAPARPCSNF